MKRIFLARKLHEVIFVSETEPGSDRLKLQAKRYIKEQDKYFDPPIELTQISTKDQIPEGDWRGGAFIWGTDDLKMEEITATEFLDTHGDAEYQEYLRLKNKYETRKALREQSPSEV